MLYVPAGPPQVQSPEAKVVLDYLNDELMAISRAMATATQTIGGASWTSLGAGTTAVLLHYEHNLTHWSLVSAPCSRAGTFKNLRCFSTSAPGSGQSYTYHWLREGNLTGITCVTSDGSNQSEDLVNRARFAQGERYCLYIVPSAGASGQAHSFGIDFEPE